MYAIRSYYDVTTASDFNREFTDNIKTKMYYYVIDSQYSEGMPTEEVKSAERIAIKLIETTAEKDSLRAINSVLNLCHNLEDKMQEIAVTEGYDSRMSQLNDNIYVMADLIQEYMYTYLYYDRITSYNVCYTKLLRFRLKHLLQHSILQI